MSRQLRKKPRISYAELDEPSPDEYVFCTQCGDYVYEYCCVHGALLVVPDDKVPSKSPYPPVVPRAALTIPHVFLHIAPSIIPGAGLGVFATLTLPCGVRFGPYRGRKTTDLTSWYSWQIYDRNGKPSHVVDADDPNNSNWMRYVNCSRHSCEQNLVAYQYRGELYYRTIKIIPRFTELMVFYGGEFAHLLHIDIRAYNRPLLYTQRHGAPLKKTSKATDKTPPKASSSEINESKLSRAARGDCDTNKENRQKLQSEEPKAKILKKSTNKKYTPPIKKTNESLNISNIPLNNRNIENSNSTDKQDISPEPVAKIAKYAQPTLKNDENTVANKLQTNEVKQFNVVRENFLQNDLLCDICNYKTNKKKTLEYHLILHTQDKNILKCSCCGYMTKQKSNLMAHMRTHTGEKPFTCEVCNYKFTKSGNMKKHMRTHTGEKPYTCDVCDYKCTQSGDMKRHRRIHTGEKPFACNVCNYKCTQSGSMKSHMRIHTGEKPFTCEVCNYKFTKSGNMKKHMRTHTGEKPYTCNVCNYKCTQSGSMKSHMRIHTGEKPYTCEVCNYKCTQSGSMKSHMRIHTGEKPYTCEVCNYKSAYSGDMKRHMRTHTGEKQNMNDTNAH